MKEPEGSSLLFLNLRSLVLIVGHALAQKARHLEGTLILDRFFTFGISFVIRDDNFALSRLIRLSSLRPRRGFLTPQRW